MCSSCGEENTALYKGLEDTEFVPLRSTKIDQLPLSRNNGNDIYLQGTGAVTMHIIYDCVLWTGAQGVVFSDKIFRENDSRGVVMEVRFGRGIYRLARGVPR